ncbi:MAG: hypothetical protein ACRDQX_10915 [Pseudonocardiaceae bacterium]
MTLGHDITATDHLAVLTATFAQIPAEWCTDVLVSIDGAGVSREVIDYLTSLNTAPVHGKRGRRVEYSIGWPVDERTLSGIEQLREGDWGAALDADGAPDPAAQAADLTGVLRHSAGGDRLARWPADMRVFARRTPRPGRQAGQARRAPRLRVRRVRHQHRRWTGPVPRRAIPHPGPRRGPRQAVQGPRRPQPALDRPPPQHRLAAPGRPGPLADRLAAPPRTRWRAGQRPGTDSRPYTPAEAGARPSRQPPQARPRVEPAPTRAPFGRSAAPEDPTHPVDDPDSR